MIFFLKRIDVTLGNEIYIIKIITILCIKQPSLLANIVNRLKDITQGQGVKYFTEDHYDEDEKNDVMEFVEFKSLDSGMTCTI